MPKRAHNELSFGKIKTLKKPGVYADGNGLALRVDEKGNRRWVQRLSIDGKQVWRGLGPYPAVTLADARRTALDAYAANRTGNAPLSSQTPATAATPVLTPVATLPAPDLNIPTFSELAARKVESLAPTWKGGINSDNGKGWARSIKRANAVIGDKRVDTITKADVLAIVEPIWVSKYPTAERTLGRIEMVLDTAVWLDWLPFNPANKTIRQALVAVNYKGGHHAAMSYTDLPAMLEKLADDTGYAITKLAFEFTLLTCTRLSETRFALWAEMDLEAGAWNIPAGRMKADRVQNVPLSRRALEILAEARELAGDSKWVFPTPHSKISEPMSREALPKMQRRIVGKGFTIHGLRSSFRDWASELTEYSEDACKAVLAHLIGDNATERAYLRTTKFEERKAVMADWADYLRP